MDDGGAAARQWLGEQCAQYEFDLAGVFRLNGHLSWPIAADDAASLAQTLADGGHILPLPQEPAALANVLEVSLVDFLLERAKATKGVIVLRGSERGYPDLELSGPRFGGGFHAVDVKVAKRRVTKTGRPTNLTQSRITLYTGNTYFRYPQLHWPGTFRPFDEYTSHLDLIGIYTLNYTSLARIEDLELIVHEAWRIASKQRSSTTREYIGAVQHIDALREGRGEFDSPEAFYAYWRKYNFRIGRVVQQQLDKLLKG
ncbi:restriction endonuclease [Mycobacterium sp. SM1]|uniref:type II restriction endonuclease n=1 Tax=Mycobacterium sp. SM1 TaxID=2816243 RepID=UPI001BCD6B16|nr:type II restriction endonuclease [Mycobacterium sp. SM1]MBS4727797.1 restriction endonuclease [Mycobacterium sp. SM1]